MATKSKKEDALELARMEILVNDLRQAYLKRIKEEALALAKMLYPDQVAAGKEFVHNGKIYGVKHTKKWDFSHVTIAPIFSELRAAEKALAKAKKKRDNLLETIFKRYPHLQPKSDSLTLYIKRSKEESKALSKLEKVSPQQFIDADFKQHREL